MDADLGTSSVDVSEVHCNPAVAYAVVSDVGQNAPVVADWAMKRTGELEPVACQIYSDARRARMLTSVAGTGTSTPSASRMYGRVPPQAAPQFGAYRDVVTATVGV
ncbi:spore coat U domain-containing protein [Sphingomonas sp. IC-56]|uniref:spore coat protein U domain-containing protein n=1 Tax=Sphingomonas sp. IC-56 TaxID=2898529 RepID=UPI001E3884FE|nr:spore coat protein U domain-containing protein [Sphingomonas sp. IC-56]MCD2324422.1 spore coat U domain-containing protein [Sphingomonas sp. IC-56]